MAEAVKPLEVHELRQPEVGVSVLFGLSRAGTVIAVGVALWLVALVVTAIVAMIRGAFFAVDWIGARLFQIGGSGGGGIVFDAIWPVIVLAIIAAVVGIRAGLDEHDRRRTA